MSLEAMWIQAWFAWEHLEQELLGIGQLSSLTPAVYWNSGVCSGVKARAAGYGRERPRPVRTESGR
jgi:hypothetical protein